METQEATELQNAQPQLREYELRLKGMSCGSCERIIERVVTSNGASVRSIDAKTGTVVIACREDQLDSLKSHLAQKGFTEGEGNCCNRGDLSGVKKYLLALLAGEPQVEVETKLMNYAIISAATLVFVGAFGSGLLLKVFGNAANTISFLMLIIAASVMTVFSYFHMACYKRNMSCTNGMMVGMTTGMVAGFLMGAIVGATNGMFVGSVVGLASGATIGIGVGRYSGIMGAMEGIMAGLMSGLMGAMTSIMLLNDNLLAMLYILAGISVVTLGGLSYMMYREEGSAPVGQLGARIDNFFMASAALSALLLLIIAYGPKGPITYI